MTSEPIQRPDRTAIRIGAVNLFAAALSLLNGAVSLSRGHSLRGGVWLVIGSFWLYGGIARIRQGLR